tara:strand:- start:1183 stop:1800 length:618 start_codon:yes stop_codon:yes gene_type:complete
MSIKNNNQLKYWKANSAYIKRNKNFDNKLGKKVWQDLLKDKKINTVLECGSNIGRNLKQINLVDPTKKLSFIEINKQAYEICLLNKNISSSFNESIENCKINKNQFDLVFTAGVLIHVNKENLSKIIKNIIDWSNKYVLVMEYFSTNDITKKYRGKNDLLFLRDYGQKFLNTKRVKLINCGFLYSKIYRKAGFDDLTYWIFKKLK